MSLPPGGEAAVALALLEGKGLIDLIEPAFGQLDRLDDAARVACTVEAAPVLTARAAAAGVPLRPVGRATGTAVRLGGGTVPLAELAGLHAGALATLLD